ncbi:MAG: recombinase family protein [Pirellulaceae bacterium]
METITQTKTTAFIYIRVSTPSQQIEEQLKTVRQYVEENDIEVIGQYGDYRNRLDVGQLQLKLFHPLTCNATMDYGLSGVYSRLSSDIPKQ